MVSAEDILHAADDIARNFHPRRITLFGSYAYGQPTLDSDIDLLVITDYKGKAYKLAGQILAHLGGHLDTEILVRNERELQERVAQNDFFMLDIVEKGIVLYDSTDERMGRQGRRRLCSRLNRVQKTKVA